MADIPPRRTSVPEGASGRWRVERFTVHEVDPAAPDVRPAWARDDPGTYTQLLCDEELFMSDLHAELHTQAPAIHEARARGGRILVTGLGLGLVVEAILAEPRPAVTEIVVVEQSADVIALVEPYLAEKYAGAVRVVQADALAYRPADVERFTVGWHDIWSSPQAPVATEQSYALIERYADVCDWQGAWPLVFLEAEAAARS